MISRRQRRIPWVGGSVPQDRSPALQMPAASPGCDLCFCPTSHKVGFQRPPPNQDVSFRPRRLHVHLTDWLYIRGSHGPLFGFDYFARAAHGMREIHVLPAYYKRMSLPGSRTEEMQGQGSREGTRSFPALARCTPVPKCPRVHQPGSSPNPLLAGFHRDVIIQTQLMNSLVISESSSSPASLPSLQVETQSSNPLVTWLPLLATSPHPQVLPKVTSFT